MKLAIALPGKQILLPGALGHLFSMHKIRAACSDSAASESGCGGGTIGTAQSMLLPLSRGQAQMAKFRREADDTRMPVDSRRR